MTDFDDALKIWAKKYLKDEWGIKNAEILEATVIHREASGYCHTCAEDELLDIGIKYVHGGFESEKWATEYDRAVISQFKLLQELFSQED